MKKGFSFLAGIIIGATLFGGTTAVAASGILATLSSHPIYVDGQQVSMEAYNINGNNYVKLRDIGEKVGFNVYWDNGVQVDSDATYTGEAPSQNNAAITIPQSDARLTLKEGDLVQCDDGSVYTITDMSRYDKNAFASGPLGALPVAACDWSSFPVVELPKAEARHYDKGASGDYLFIRNLYETRRMQYTLYNACATSSDTWENGSLKLSSKGNPLFRISLSIPDENIDNAQTFWPWRESDLLRVFEGCPAGAYYVESWDVYKDGVFLYTEYLVYAP